MRIGLDRLADVSGKVGFGARGSDAGSDDLSSGHIHIGDETLGAVSAIFKFLSRNVTGLHGQRRVEPFEGLDAVHLIGTGDLGTGRCIYGRGTILHNAPEDTVA